MIQNKKYNVVLAAECVGETSKYFYLEQKKSIQLISQGIQLVLISLLVGSSCVMLFVFSSVTHFGEGAVHL